MTEEQKLSLCYQPLFDYLYNEYGIILLISEMDEIINLVEKVKENLNEAF